MKKLFITLVSAGMNAEEYDHSQNVSIQISNFVGLLFTVVIGLPFLVITGLYFTPLIWLPLVGTAMFLMVIPLNLAGMILMSRVVLVLAPNLLGNIYIAYLIDGSQDIPQSLSMVTCSFTVMPIALFSWRERAYSIGLFALVLGLVLAQPLYQDWFYLLVPTHTELFEEVSWRVPITAMGVVVNGMLMLTLIYRYTLLEKRMY